MRLLEVSTATGECGDDRGGDIGFQQRCRKPMAWTDMYEIDCGSSIFGVIEPGPVETAQPEQPVGIARPREGARFDGGEARDAAAQSVIVLRCGQGDR